MRGKPYGTGRSMKRAKLLVASANAGKVAEYRSLLDGVPCDLVSLADAGIRGDVAETGETYEENARLKAVFCAERSGLVTLAGVLVCLAGIAVCGWAGISKERELSDAQKRETISMVPAAAAEMPKTSV